MASLEVSIESQVSTLQARQEVKQTVLAMTNRDGNGKILTGATGVYGSKSPARASAQLTRRTGHSSRQSGNGGSPPWPTDGQNQQRWLQFTFRRDQSEGHAEQPLSEDELDELFQQLKHLSGDSTMALKDYGQNGLCSRGSVGGFSRLTKLMQQGKLHTALDMPIQQIKALQELPPDPEPKTGKSYQPPQMYGLNCHLDKPEAFDFLVFQGDDSFSAEAWQKIQSKLIHYFMTALALDESDIWANLSSLEPNRVLPEAFSKTVAGIDILAQDCLFKQRAAFLLQPDTETGEKFWASVSQKHLALYGMAPQSKLVICLKICMRPKRIKIQELGPHTEKSDSGIDESLKVIRDFSRTGLSAFSMVSNIRVVCDPDRVALKEHWQKQHHSTAVPQKAQEMNDFCVQAFSKHILPSLEVIVNEDKSFVNIRQFIKTWSLATWCKEKFHNVPGYKDFFDTNKPREPKHVSSGDAPMAYDASEFVANENVQQALYHQYLDSLDGTQTTIQTKFDEDDHPLVTNTYFSGGIDFTNA